MAKRMVNLVFIKNDVGEIILNGVYGRWEKAYDRKAEIQRDGHTVAVVTDVEMNTEMLLRVDKLTFSEPKKSNYIETE